MVFEKLRARARRSVERHRGSIPQFSVSDTVSDFAPEVRGIEHLHEAGVVLFFRFPVYPETERVRGDEHRPRVPVAFLQNEVARVVAVGTVEPDPGPAVLARAERRLR